MDLGPLLTGAAAVAFVLASAKAHGRQLRLEREARGVAHVDFRRANDPWVEALWRRDRVGFWSLFAGLAVGSVLLLFLLRPAGVLGWLALALAWSFAACFVAMGLASLARGLRADPRVGGIQASLLWFGLALALGVAVALLAFA